MEPVLIYSATLFKLLNLLLQADHSFFHLLSFADNCNVKLYLPYSSKFLWHNIFMNFVIWLLITKIFLTYAHGGRGYMLCSAESASASAHWRIASTGTYVHVPVMFFHSNGSQRLEVSRTCLSYEGRPDGLKASDARLELETAQHYFDSFLFTLTSPNATCMNCGRSDNVNYQRRHRGAEVITKNLAIMKFLSWKFTFMWFLAISRKFWTTKIWSYTVYSSILIISVFVSSVFAEMPSMVSK